MFLYLCPQGLSSHFVTYRIFDLLQGVENKCVVIVVSPLIALMKNLVTKIVVRHVSNRHKIGIYI